jgi:hypothetical protein
MHLRYTLESFQFLTLFKSAPPPANPPQIVYLHFEDLSLGHPLGGLETESRNQPFLIPICRGISPTDAICGIEHGSLRTFDYAPSFVPKPRMAAKVIVDVTQTGRASITPTQVVTSTVGPWLASSRGERVVEIAPVGRFAVRSLHARRATATNEECCAEDSR